MLPIGSETRADGVSLEPLQIGKHATCFEEPDTIWMKLVGDVTLEEVQVINACHLGYSRGRPNVFFLIDLEQLEGISTSVRKEVLATLNQMTIGGFSIYKAPMTARVIVKLIIVGMKLFGKHLPLEFWESEAEARSWIEQSRTAAVS